MNIDILYENKEIIAVCKPQNIPVQKDQSHNQDLLSSVEFYLKLNNRLNPKEHLHLINRLDRPVGGIVLMAKNSKAAKIYTEILQKNKITKEYLAVTDNIPNNISGNFTDFILKNSGKNISEIVDEYTGKKAILEYILVESIENISLLKIHLITGRHHQIRSQLSHHNLPIWGDTKYNCRFSKSTQVNIALWSYHIQFINPFDNDEPIEIFSFPDREIEPWNLFQLE
ncbi:MAG: RNA pseudouridine synthase [Clostridiales bacterium]|nr:RNA pseudouridine synthase [Clostridiales bacterium]